MVVWKLFSFYLFRLFYDTSRDELAFEKEIVVEDQPLSEVPVVAKAMERLTSSEEQDESRSARVKVTSESPEEADIKKNESLESESPNTGNGSQASQPESGTKAKDSVPVLTGKS